MPFKIQFPPHKLWHVLGGFGFALPLAWTGHPHAAVYAAFCLGFGKEVGDYLRGEWYAQSLVDILVTVAGGLLALLA